MCVCVGMQYIQLVEPLETQGWNGRNAQVNQVQVLAVFRKILEQVLVVLNHLGGRALAGSLVFALGVAVDDQGGVVAVWRWVRRTSSVGYFGGDGGGGSSGLWLMIVLVLAEGIWRHGYVCQCTDKRW